MDSDKSPQGDDCCWVLDFSTQATQMEGISLEGEASVSYVSSSRVTAEPDFIMKRGGVGNCSALHLKQHGDLLTKIPIVNEIAKKAEFFCKQ